MRKITPANRLETSEGEGPKSRRIILTLALLFTLAAVATTAYLLIKDDEVSPASAGQAESDSAETPDDPVVSAFTSETPEEPVVAERPEEGFVLFNEAIVATTPWHNDVDAMLGPYEVENEAVLLNTWWALRDWCVEAGHDSSGHCYDIAAKHVEHYFDRDPRTINSETWGNPGAIGALFDAAYAVTAEYLGIETMQDLDEERPGTAYLCEPSCEAAEE